MLRWKNLTWKHLFIFLLLLHLAPLWIIHYFPSQDGPSHVYNALVLKEYHKHENYKLRDVFKLNITIFPNWLAHLILALLLYIFPPIIAEKILLTLAVGLVPISFFYFLDAVHKRGFLFGWLGFLFSYNYLLFMGFYSFALSISFFFFSFGYWWRHKEDFRINHIIVLYILLLTTYLCHIVSYGLLLLAMLVVASCLWGSEAIAAAWRKLNDVQSSDGRAKLLLSGRAKLPLSRMLRNFLSELKPLVRFVGCMLPAYFVLMEYYLQSLRDYSGGYYKSMDWISDYFWGIKSIVYFTDWHVPVHRVLLGVLSAAIIVSLVYRIRRKQWLKTTDVFLVMGILFTIMFIKAPWRLGPGGWIKDRIHIYILLMLALWLVPNMGKTLRFGFTVALVVISLIHLGRTTYDHARLNTEIEELTSGVHLMEPHTTYYIRSPDWRKSEVLGYMESVGPYKQAMAFYGMANADIGYLRNYEARLKYFPVDLNEGYKGIVDYIIAWSYPEEEEFTNFKQKYDLIYQTRRLKLFRRKLPDGPDLSAWSWTPDQRLIIRFDIQPKDGTTAEGYHSIDKDTGYASGRFGWVTKSPHSDSQDVEDISTHGGDLSPRDQDYVWDTDDAAFKLDLPNGIYRVTNFFCSAEDVEHEVNLLANGKQVIKKLIVPAGKKIAEHTYTITIEKGYLTQIIYTPRKRVPSLDKHNHWVWNGFTVEQLSKK